MSEKVFMKKFIIVFAAVLVVTGGAFYLWLQQNSNKPSTLPRNVSQQQQSNQFPPADVPQTSTIVEDLDTPWSMAFLPDGKLLVTERFGRVLIVDPAGSVPPVVAATPAQVTEIGEGGLMGIVLHPNFETNRYVYLYYTYSGSGSNTLNRVVRMQLENNTLANEKVIVDAIPGAANHNGGRIAFGPDNLLYIGTGDAQEPSQAQDKNSLAGKILRVTDEGSPAPGNPFNNRTFSYGHRNVQGLTFDSSGKLWATEHGRSGALSGFDEVNLITSGSNYGWPDSEGDTVLPNTVAPKRHSGASTTWAPGGIVFLNGSLYFTGLRGAALYEATLAGEQISGFQEHFTNQYGRIRDVIASPDGLLYIAISNQDGRGRPNTGDDKIIRVNPAKL